MSGEPYPIDPPEEDPRDTCTHEEGWWWTGEGEIECPVCGRVEPQPDLPMPEVS
jgi:hypothetical protein